MLDAYWGIAAPLITRRFGGEVEKFIGDGIMAVFNNRGDQPDHAQRASSAALALQSKVARLVEQHPDWPRLRVGVNSGAVVVREIGGDGHVAYPFGRRRGQYRRSPRAPGSCRRSADRHRDVHATSGRGGRRRVGRVAVKGKDDAVDAYVLHALPA